MDEPTRISPFYSTPTFHGRKLEIAVFIPLRVSPAADSGAGRGGRTVGSRFIAGEGSPAPASPAPLESAGVWAASGPEFGAGHPEPQPSPGPHVLVIDDAADVLELLGAVLDDEGYRVSLRRTLIGVDEIELLAPDLIVLDLVFGGEPRGIGLLDQLRQADGLVDVPVVICSASVDGVRRLDAAGLAGRVGLVLKPFDLEEFLAALRAFGRSRPSEGSPD